MPTDCEPCPGKTKAKDFMAKFDNLIELRSLPTSDSRLQLQIQQHSTPGEAAADAFEHHRIARLHPTVTTTLFMGSFSFFAVPCMMRILA